MFVDDNHRQMREFMLMTEGYIAHVGHDREVFVEHEVEPAVAEPHPIHASLLDLVQRLRMFTESSSGEYAFGVEMGMQRAADMLENVLNDNFG